MRTEQFLDLKLEEIDFMPTLDPFIVERFPIQSLEWKNEVRLLSRRWRRRMWRRLLFGWLPKGGHMPRVLRGKRTQEYVGSSYEDTWGRRPWPDTHSTPDQKKILRAEWEEEGLFVRWAGLQRIHLLFIAQALSVLQPRTILEVGSGYGLNLFVLSSRYPNIEWSGIELTQNGVAQAKAVQQGEDLPDPLIRYLPWPTADHTAYKKITFRQGDATKLPFSDDSFDLVLTRQALEQMDMVRDAALKEIARVARHYVLMVEPVADFNQDPLRNSYVRAKDYFSLPVGDLPSFGIEPVTVFHQFPQNITLGHGIVLGQVHKSSLG